MRQPNKMSDEQRHAAEAILVEAVMKLVKLGLTEGNVQRVVGDGSFLHSYAKAHIDAGIRPSARSIRYLNHTLSSDVTTESLLEAVNVQA
jgi:hypothetical protein